MTIPGAPSLGAFLKDRRARLDPAALGFPVTRRRTPGLRREEVAQRANVSATWYTWLEQDRGGGPSADVLDRVARALALTPAEREHLFNLAKRGQPDGRARAAGGHVTPGLQLAIDSMDLSPAIVKNAAWDILAWNHAAATVLTDYAALEPGERNILRLLFCDPRVRARMPDWDAEARFAVARFRLESARGRTGRAAGALVEELSGKSAAFAELWRRNEVHSFGEGTKHITHPRIGSLALEYASFAVDGQPDLGLVVYTPSTPADRARVRSIAAAPPCNAGPAQSG